VTLAEELKINEMMIENIIESRSKSKSKKDFQMHEGPDQTDDISPNTSKCGTYEDESDDEMETII
jgi:hypothetical protein